MKDLSSRFDGAPTYRHAGAEDGARELYRPRAQAPSPAVLLHRVIAGDRLDLLAYRYFGDAAQYWRIADANPSTTPDELLEPGRILRIPQGT